MTNLVSVDVSDLNVDPGKRSLSWKCGAVHIRKEWRLPIEVCHVLHDRRSVAVIESIEETGPGNGVVFNHDGSERFRITPPILERESLGFGDIYYADNELTAILVAPGRDIAVVIDESNGSCVRWYETR